MESRTRLSVSRRSFIRNTAKAALAGAIVWSARPLVAAAADPRGATAGHLAWVWQFADDGPPDKVRSVLATNGLGIIMKTHDGTDWMARYDPSSFAISGPSALSALAKYFENGGVPFHAWAVVKGIDPDKEAVLAAETLSAGARSLVLDLEPSDGGSYWEGSPDAARYFGRKFRTLQPNAWLAVAPDPRPWQVEEVPIAEFARFSNEFAPQTYWDTFDNRATKSLLRERGFQVGAEGITPEVTLDFTRASLGRFGLPIRPVGQGDSDTDSWRRFISHAYTLGMGAVSVWRYGTSNPEVWRLLHESPAKAPSQPSTQQAPQASAARPVTPPPPPAPATSAPPVQVQPAAAAPAAPAASQEKTAAPVEPPRLSPAPPEPITLDMWGSRSVASTGDATSSGGKSFTFPRLDLFR